MERRRHRKGRDEPRRSFPWFTLLVIGVVLVGIYFAASAVGLFEPRADAGQQIDPNQGKGGPVAGVQQTDQGNAHLQPGQRFTAYNTRPPTSGPHDQSPVPWGNYDREESAPDERVVHSMEHGGVVISYNQIAPEDVAKIRLLRSRFQPDRFGSVKIITRPYPQIPAGTIALTAWRWLDTMTTYDERRIIAFINQHVNECCEAVP